MQTTKRTTRLVGAAVGLAAAAALLAGCQGTSAGPAAGSTAGSTPTGPAAGSATSAAPAAQAASCTPQTKNISGETAAQILQTMVAEMPDACGFTVLPGDVEGAGEADNTVELAGDATYDSAGDIHVVIDNQGMTMDTYVIGGTTYLRIYVAGSPNATPDQDSMSFWHLALSTSSAAKLSSTEWVKLTSAQTAKFAPGGDPSGIEGSPSMASAAALAADLANGDGVTWTLAGTQTVDGISCTLVTHPAGSQNLPKTTLAIDTATGLPVEVTYGNSNGNSTLSFKDWGTTPTITAPSPVIDGASLS